MLKQTSLASLDSIERITSKYWHFFPRLIELTNDIERDRYGTLLFSFKHPCYTEVKTDLLIIAIDINWDDIDFISEEIKICSVNEINIKDTNKTEQQTAADSSKTTFKCSICNKKYIKIFFLERHEAK